MKFTPNNLQRLKVRKTNIPGLLVFDLPVFGDSRGWFKENWQRQKMVELGLPDFHPVQNNISYNEKAGVTRGLHAEPWDKFVSVASGSVYAFWIDLREGNEPKFFGIKIDPSVAVFVPRGVANGYQALEDRTTYIYLVNEHWEPGIKYPSLNLKEVADKLPIRLSQAEVSDKDKLNPMLDTAKRLPALKTFITGGKGQLGAALKKYFPQATYSDIDTFNITDEKAYQSIDWSQYSTIINAAAYTNVDEAETPEGRKKAWASNALAVKNMAQIAKQYNLALVHVSSDYVFDGTVNKHYEEEPLTPLGVYGQSKAAGDLIVQTINKYYLLRTSWVVGKGKNFIKTMYELSQKQIKPSVVSDQYGRLTFAEDLAKAIFHLISSNQQYGTYNMTNDGKVASWADIAKMVYKQAGCKESDVASISTEEYFKDKRHIAPRPSKSALDLNKIKATGFKPRDWQVALSEYIKQLKKEVVK